MLCAAAFFEQCIAGARKIAHNAQNADNARKNTAFPLVWLAAIKPESDAGRRGLRLADNDKISCKGHRTALRCCRCPFYIAAVQLTAK